MREATLLRANLETLENIVILGCRTKKCCFARRRLFKVPTVGCGCEAGLACGLAGIKRGSKPPLTETAVLARAEPAQLRQGQVDSANKPMSVG